MDFFFYCLFLFSISGSKTQESPCAMVKLIDEPTKMNWDAALTECKLENSDPVMIRNNNEHLDFIHAHGWIGLFQENAAGQWKWSHENEMANNPADNLGDAQPWRCIYKNANETSWKSFGCSKTMCFACFTCFKNKLVVVQESKTWEEALDHCRALPGANTDGPSNGSYRYDLASLITSDDHALARVRAQEATTDEVWTSLRFLAGEWWWVDQEAKPDLDMESCPTDKLCGVMEKGGAKNLGARDCRERRNFMCLKKF